LKLRNAGKRRPDRFDGTGDALAVLRESNGDAVLEPGPASAEVRREHDERDYRQREDHRVDDRATGDRDCQKNDPDD
jgi:hypothetical protein